MNLLNFSSATEASISMVSRAYRWLSDDFIPSESYQFRPVAYFKQRTIQSSDLSPRQKTILIRDLGTGQLSLREPLDVSVEQSAYHVSAFVPALNDFEIAHDEGDVLAAIKASIVDLYLLLKENRQHLGPIPAAQWAVLRHIIQEN